MAETEAGRSSLGTKVFRAQRRRSFNPAEFGFSRLAAKIIALNLVGLTLLLFATLHIAQLRLGAAQATLDSMLSQAAVLSAALMDRPGGPAVGLNDGSFASEVVTVGGIDVGGSIAPTGASALNEREVRHALLQGVGGSAVEARIYGADGMLLGESGSILRDDDTFSEPRFTVEVSWTRSLWDAIADRTFAPPLPPLPPLPRGAQLEEVMSALGGMTNAALREGEEGNVRVSLATPLTLLNGTIAGALHLVSAPDAVSATARKQEYAIARGFVLAMVVAIFASLALAASISRPLSQLARAAERIRGGGTSKPMPALQNPGEVGDLSRALDGMTTALYERIDAIEAFADEVAHELKNPLTSLRSAVETLPLATSEDAQERLREVIAHDVKRIDRLISDISNASKLDAELSRQRHNRFNLVMLLRGVVEDQNELAASRGQTVRLKVRDRTDAYVLEGSDSRLSQVFTNLVDNARSFSADGGEVVLTAKRYPNFVEVTVDDDGPGFAEDMTERIFERFYTDRSSQRSFGNNSGLGLAISRQIVEAHDGEIFAENRYRSTLAPERDVAGARLTVRLPLPE